MNVHFKEKDTDCLDISSQSLNLFLESEKNTKDLKMSLDNHIKSFQTLLWDNE